MLFFLSVKFSTFLPANIFCVVHTLVQWEQGDLSVVNS